MRRFSRDVPIVILALCLAAGCAAESADESDAADATASEAAAEAPARAETDAPGGAGPTLVQPGVISTDRNETFPAVDPVDGSLWLSMYDRSFDAQTILRAPREADGWGTPVVVSFSGQHGDRAPRFSTDGARLYFTSNRPALEGAPAGDMNIWVVERTADGWSEPMLLPAPVNSPDGREIHAALSADGALYLASNRPDGHGRSDIYRFTEQNGRWTAEHLPAPVNDSLSQPDLLIAPNGEWMILAITEHPQGLGGDDLFLLRREGDGWSAPVPLGAPINSAEYEYGPTLGPDGYLYFTSHRRGSADVYRVPLSEVLR